MAHFGLSLAKYARQNPGSKSELWVCYLIRLASFSLASRFHRLLKKCVQSHVGIPPGDGRMDNDHLVAKELQKQLSSSQICCQRNGVVWDVAALYPKDMQWGTSTPVFFGGAVLDVAGDVRQRLSAMSGSR